METIMISHEVKNFPEWKKGFDEDAANRSAHGVVITGVFQSFDNPNFVSVVSEVPSVDVIKGMISNPEFREIMEKAGVIGTPAVKVLSNI